MADHGLRQDEAMNIQWRDVDEANEIIRVRGKGNKDRRVPFMSDRFADELDKADRSGKHLVINKRVNPFVFNLIKDNLKQWRTR
jgi:site-specific recombinase XerD